MMISTNRQAEALILAAITQWPTSMFLENVKDQRIRTRARRAR